MLFIVEKPESRTALKTFNKIINAAEKIIYEKGYFNCTIADISKEAGIAVGTIYLYFDSKYTIYVYIMQKYEHELKTKLKEALKACDSRLEKEVAGIKAFVLEAIKNPKCYNLIWESLYVDKDLFFTYYKNFAKSYVKGLSKASDELVPNIDLNTLAYTLIGISNFVGLEAIAEENISEDRINEMMNTIKTLLESGVFKKTQNEID